MAGQNARTGAMRSAVCVSSHETLLYHTPVALIHSWTEQHEFKSHSGHLLIDSKSIHAGSFHGGLNQRRSFILCGTTCVFVFVCIRLISSTAHRCCLSEAFDRNPIVSCLNP